MPSLIRRFDAVFLCVETFGEPSSLFERHTQYGCGFISSPKLGSTPMRVTAAAKRCAPIVMVIATTIFTMTATATSAEKSAPKHEVTARSSKRPPPVVDGVPLLALAKHALGAAEEYSVSKPSDVRVVVATHSVLSKPGSQSVDPIVPEYIITLQGRFTCGFCDTAEVPTRTTTLMRIAISTMEIEVPKSNLSATIGLYVGVTGLGDPDLSKMGRVYDLDPYIASLAGVPVPIGPAPGSVGY